MGRLMSQELDRERPLWETWVIDGLSDDRWALISKVHHCMVDGVSGTDMMAVLLGSRPRRRHGATRRVGARRRNRATTRLVVDAAAELAVMPFRIARRAMSDLGHPRRDLALARPTCSPGSARSPGSPDRHRRCRSRARSVPIGAGRPRARTLADVKA